MADLGFQGLERLDTKILLFHLLFKLLTSWSKENEHLIFTVAKILQLLYVQQCLLYVCVRACLCVCVGGGGAGVCVCGGGVSGGGGALHA